MQEIPVHLKENSYSIFIQGGILDEAGAYIRRVFSGEKVFVLTDETVGAHYGERVLESIRRQGFTAMLFALPPGEKTKCMRALLRVYDALLDFELTRSGLIVTLGGGVIGDLGGFAAATYLRGVPFVQIPTSLLAQVDSSVGGKVAVDLPRGKNLAGCFYQPKTVLIDPQTLTTLSDHFFRDGMGEVIKTACIRDANLFDLLLGWTGRAQIMEHMEQVVAACCTIKKGIVERDERDMGERILLNFGHTLGHAVEKFEQFEGHSHGEAVAIGMHAITRLSERKGLTQPGTAARVQAILQAHGLPNKLEGNLPALLDGIRYDKKHLNGTLKVVLLHTIGDSYIYDAGPHFFDGL